MQYTGIYTTLEFCINHQAFEWSVDIECVEDEDLVRYNIEDGRCDTATEAWASIAQCTADLHRVDWYEG